MRNPVRKPGLAGLQNPGAVMARHTSPDVCVALCAQQGVRHMVGAAAALQSRA